MSPSESATIRCAGDLTRWVRMQLYRIRQVTEASAACGGFHGAHVRKRGTMVQAKFWGGVESMQIELERVQTGDGITLHGALRRPDAAGASTNGADLVILHHGVGGNFYNLHFFD